MTTSESHGAISGSRVSDERLAEMLADAVSEVARKPRDETVYDFTPEEMVAALTELQSLRSSMASGGLDENRQYDHCKDLSKQGWSALSDARLFLNLGTASDIEEAKQCIDIAQSSFADTIISSETRAREAEASLRSEPSEPVAVKRWLIEETLPSGAIRWEVVEHEHHAREKAAMGFGNAVVTPLYASPQPGASS